MAKFSFRYFKYLPEIKYCNDCKHYSYNKGIRFCKLDKSIKRSSIDGEYLVESETKDHISLNKNLNNDCNFYEYTEWGF